MEKFLMEDRNMKQVSAPADLNAAAVTGARISMKGNKRISVALSFGDSTAAACTISFQEHDAVSAGNSQALALANNYYYKADGATVFTKVELSTAASSFDLAAIFAAAGGIVVFEILAEDLDTADDFAWISCNVADSTAAKVMSGLYIVDEEFKPAYTSTL